MAKAMTASQYRKLLQKKREATPAEPVTVPSGMVFMMIRPDLQAYIVTGRYPQSLVHEGIKVLRERGIAPTDPKAISAIGSSLEPEEFNNALIFLREMVRECCVSPRIVVGAQGDDEIEPGEIDIDDFNYMVEWCVNYKGVKNAEGIRNFRAERQQPARHKSHGKKLRDKTVRVS